MTAEKSFNIKESVLLLKMLNGGALAVIDAHNALRLIDVKSYKVVGGFKTNIVHERFYGNHVDIAPGGGLCVSVIPKSNKAAIFSVAKKGLLFKAGRHQGEVESVAIDPAGRYVVTAGQDGKTFAWSLKTGKLAFNLPPHSDYVTAVTFSENGQWLATGSYDKSITLLNLATMKKPHKLRGHSAAIYKMVFLPSLRLLSLDKEGSMIVWDINQGKNLKRMTKVNDDVTAMTVSHDYRFLFVGTKLGYIALYDLESYELLSQKYLKVSETVSALGFIEEGFRLAVGTIEGNVGIYPLFGDQAHLEAMLRQREYKLFYEVIERNPVLMYSELYKSAERLWEATIAKAKKLLGASEKNAAVALLEPFRSVPKKGLFINQLLRDFEQYATFQKYVVEGRYPLAYSMAKQFKSFEESDLYKKMEKRWRVLFMKAQELILTKNGEEEAKTLLAPFRGISEKAVLIQQLFSERKLYLYFKKIIAQKEFVKLFELVKNHPFLKEFEEYHAVNAYADKLFIKAQQAYLEEDYVTAQKVIAMLDSFPDFAAEVQQMRDTMKAKRLFYDAISAGNIKNAFSYLSSYPLLYETKEGMELERGWNDAVDTAMRHAAKGDTRALLGVIEAYQEVDVKYEVMAHLFAQAALTQLEQALLQRLPIITIETGMRNYLALFGEDDSIRYYVERYNMEFGQSFSIEGVLLGDLSAWTPKMILASIMESRV
ncbi:MAG: hypothetical protein JXK05_11125 [Campylobacterales bacterium]|nr:hypothetical protein [Campylobacterales bacterium]